MLLSNELLNFKSKELTILINQYQNRINIIKNILKSIDLCFKYNDIQVFKTKENKTKFLKTNYKSILKNKSKLHKILYLILLIREFNKYNCILNTIDNKNICIWYLKIGHANILSYNDYYANNDFKSIFTMYYQNKL